MNKNAIRNYELVLVFPEMDGAKLEEAKKNLQATLTRRKANILDMKTMGSRSLFHEKDHHRRGNFNVWKFTAPGDAISQITMELNVSTDVIKSMITKEA